ncbi:MAG: outer membrane beta-barrel protein [Vicinamibacteria bacterium]|nr:outer membrane beta-barrel protein [Vicinamibacteria bacterium]
MRTRALCLGVAVWAGSAAAQEAPEPAPAASDRAAGEIRLGPLILTPRLVFGGLGWESNLYLVGEDDAGSRPKVNDFVVSGGPGLGVRWPFTPKFKLDVDSDLNYIWYSETASQRRLTGGVDGRFVLDSSPVRLSAGYQYRSTFERPSPEIGQRIETIESGPVGSIGFALPGRLGFDLDVDYRDAKAPEQDDLGGVIGNEVQRRLSRTTTTVRPALSYGVTPKTRVFVEGRYEAQRYDSKTALDADTYGGGLGVRTDADTLLPGEATVGIERYEPAAGTTPPRDSVYARVELRLELSPRTRFMPRYRRERAVSLLPTLGDTQTVIREDIGLSIFKELITNRLDLQVTLTRESAQPDGDGLVIDVGSGVQAVARDEVYYGAVGDLGYRFGPLRLGVMAEWRNRSRTLVATQTAQGFRLGLSARLTPH